MNMRIGRTFVAVSWLCSASIVALLIVGFSPAVSGGGEQSPLADVLSEEEQMDALMGVLRR